MGKEWPEQKAQELQDAATRVGYNVAGLDVLGTLRSINAVVDAAQEIAADVIEIAAAETKIPAKHMAEALGVPASTLRGLRS